MFKRMCLGLALLACCSTNDSQTETAQLEFDRSRPDVPVVLFQRYGGNNTNAVFGPIVAVWADGRIVRIASDDAIGKRYEEGMLASGEVEGLLRYLTTDERIMKLDGGYIQPDSAFEQVLLRLGDQRIIYGESLGRWVPHKAEFAALRRYLMSLKIQEPRPADAPWKVPPRDWYEK